MSWGTRVVESIDWAFLFGIGLIVVALGFWWFAASMEARTYNRLTGSDVTTWEAVWVSLRVDCP